MSEISSFEQAVGAWKKAQERAVTAHAQTSKLDAEAEALRQLMIYYRDLETKGPTNPREKCAAGSCPTRKNKPEGPEQHFSKGQITRTNTRVGTRRNGQSFTKYGVQLDDKDWYNTFDATIGEYAQALEGTAQVVDAAYTQDAYGNKLVSLQPAEPDPEADLPF